MVRKDPGSTGQAAELREVAGIPLPSGGEARGRTEVWPALAWRPVGTSARWDEGGEVQLRQLRGEYSGGGQEVGGVSGEQ